MKNNLEDFKDFSQETQIVELEDEIANLKEEIKTLKNEQNKTSTVKSNTSKQKKKMSRGDKVFIGQFVISLLALLASVIVFIVLITKFWWGKLCLIIVKRQK